MNDIYVGSLFSEAYLEHHGILGMKWGVRRFQNKDGSLTGAGLKRKRLNEHKNEAEKKRGSLKGTAHRALAKVHEINEKTYNKLGNKTLASMNKAAKTQQLKKAEKADAEANAKREKTRLNHPDTKKRIVKGAAIVGTALAAYGVYKAAKAYKKWSNTDSDTRRQEIVERSLNKARKKQWDAHYSQLAKEMAAKNRSERQRVRETVAKERQERRRQEISERLMNKARKKQWDAHYSQLAKEMTARDRERRKRR